MARNRKRAKDRRTRRPAAGPPRPGVATARPGRDEPERDGTPGPLEHATPDVELADAQLAYGRSDPGGGSELSDAELESEAGFGDEPAPGGGSGGGAIAGSGSSGDGDEDAGGGALAPGGAASPARRGAPGSRLINFLQGSWRELQRVQWPDRRQVMQATGVVIGFVIVAGVFLGIADALAGKIVTFILK